ncbi:MAG: M23 family metallopeptidase [Candidatus Saccharicenans sp.]|jgi:murein DD-endopeptidase MepM/ murein hydrolase activator NlpD|nr:M23 family metallopeptidase [Candidatus Saccharicenans sp.]MDH7575811.1 M23 family metallopeptidase [Candidatus Saccharicenans sp.]
MPKKFVSIVIVPNWKTSFRTINIPQKAVRLMIGAGISFLVLFVFFLLDYFSMTMTKARYRELLKETAVQKETIATYENTISQMKETISNFEEYARKINVLAGLQSAENLKGEPGLGGGEKVDFNHAPQIKNVEPGALQAIKQRADAVEKNLNYMLHFFESQTAVLATTPTIWPTVGWVSSSFGPRIDPFTGRNAFHAGLDIATNLNNPVVATADGVVVQVGFDKYKGNYVSISHGNGFSTEYWHLNKYTVKSGQKISRGQVIGYVGKTGKALGPHLHYEVHLNGKPINPIHYIIEE